MPDIERAAAYGVNPEDVNDNVWELRDEIAELKQKVEKLEFVLRAYAAEACYGPASAHRYLLDRLDA